jgi:hypothetical protein
MDSATIFEARSVLRADKTEPKKRKDAARNPEM